MYPRIRQYPINICWRSCRIIQINLLVTDGRRHILEYVKVAISKCMMQQCFPFLQLGRGASNDVDQRHMFAVSSRDTVDC